MPTYAVCVTLCSSLQLFFMSSVEAWVTNVHHDYFTFRIFGFFFFFEFSGVFLFVLFRCLHTQSGNVYKHVWLETHSLSFLNLSETTNHLPQWLPSSFACTTFHVTFRPLNLSVNILEKRKDTHHTQKYLTFTHFLPQSFSNDLFDPFYEPLMYWTSKEAFTQPAVCGIYKQKALDKLCLTELFKC